MTTLVRILLIIGVFLLIVSPPLANLVVASDPWWNYKIVKSNDWIGFYGNFIGSLITLIGLTITILYTSSQYKDQDRKRLQPYLSVTQLYKGQHRDDTKDLTEHDYEMGYMAFNPVPTSSDDELLFSELALYGQLENIGIGTAIKVIIQNIEVENLSIEYGTNTYHALPVDGKINFKTVFFNIHLKEEQISKEYKEYRKKFIEDKEGKLHSPPEIQMRFTIQYDDMLGNTYNQLATVKIQVWERNDVQEPNVLFQEVSYPVLKK